MQKNFVTIFLGKLYKFLLFSRVLFEILPKILINLYNKSIPDME